MTTLGQYPAGMDKLLASRATVISAPIATVQALIADLHAWERWSPWQEIDPNMTQTYSGAETGVGQQMDWEGDKNAGSGRMTLVGDEPERVDIDIEFIKPFKAKNRSTFELAEIDGATHVTWNMTGKQGIFMKALFAVMRMEKSIGADFERGLAKLKSVAEAGN